MVLFDQSISMQLPDVSGQRFAMGSPSQDAAPDLTAAEGTGEELEIKVHGYDAKLHPPSLAGRPPELPGEPDGTRDGHRHQLA